MNSIWYQLGFGNASKGAQSIGAYFDIPDDVLASGCPLRLVMHITKPKDDPVMTQPVVSYIKIFPAENKMFVSKSLEE